MGGGSPPPPPPPPAVAASVAAAAPMASGPAGARGARSQRTLLMKGQIRPGDAGVGPGELGSSSVLGSNSSLGASPGNQLVTAMKSGGGMLPVASAAMPSLFPSAFR